MKKDIQKQLYRMTYVVVVMLALAIWQREFVITAINSNVFLNSIIIGTFIFGMGLMFKYQFDLRNEMTSFDALQETYNDILRKGEDERDPFWRFQRCKEPATIFSPPRIMWQAYFLISDEMARTDNLKISAGTMQTLVDGIDTKLDDQKSLTTYITGLLVFLGLIGTFVGLMVTLSSVGNIIGDLDLSGGGGTETIQKLMTNLKTPLQGMATGFSSSLFGLVTSLTLGLIGRFQNLAASSLKLGFEAWLSSVVHITDDVDGISPTATSNHQGVGIDRDHLRLMYNVAKYSLTSSNRTNRLLDRLLAAVAGLAEEQGKQSAATTELSGHMEKNAQYQGVMSYHLGRTAKALSAHEELALAASNRTNVLLDTMTSRVGDIAVEQATQADATSMMSGRMEENTQYQGVMSHHLTRIAEALAGHDDVALKLREIDVSLNTRIDDLAGSINRTSGNIESLTEEIIALGEQDETVLDNEYERVMSEINSTLEQERAERQAGVQQQEPIAVNANVGQQPAAAPPTVTYNAPLSVNVPGSDPVGNMRDKLADIYGRGEGEEK